MPSRGTGRGSGGGAGGMTTSASSASLSDASPTSRSVAGDDSLDPRAGLGQVQSSHRPSGGGGARHRRTSTTAGAPGSGAARPPMRGSTPVHTATKYSPLSSDGVWIAKHAGLLNLGVVILISTNLRCAGLWGCGFCHGDVSGLV